MRKIRKRSKIVISLLLALTLLLQTNFVHIERSNAEEPIAVNPAKTESAQATHTELTDNSIAEPAAPATLSLPAAETGENIVSEDNESAAEQDETYKGNTYNKEDQSNTAVSAVAHQEKDIPNNLLLINENQGLDTVVEDVYNSFPIKNQGGKYNAGFSSKSGQGLLSFSFKDSSLLLNPSGTNSVTADVYSNIVTYNDIYPDTDLNYTLEKDQLKEALTVHRYTGKNVFDFQLSVTDAVYELSPEGELIFYKPGTVMPLFYMPKPFVIDSNGNRCDIEFNLSGGGILKLTIDPEWLKTAAYPIVIDPTIYVCDAVFYRGTDAYKQDGTSVSYNIPRYETGRFEQAIMVESGTTNLLTANQSSVETDLTGLESNGPFGPETRTFTRDSSAGAGWHGSASAKLTSNYSGNQWISIKTVSTSISPNTAYSASINTRASVAGRNQYLYIKWYTVAASNK
ncbi:MAG: hypothetical protein WC364_02975 [Eubacteriales bacterium]|jgi:hypothetical protein